MGLRQTTGSTSQWEGSSKRIGGVVSHILRGRLPKVEPPATLFSYALNKVRDTNFFHHQGGEITFPCARPRCSGPLRPAKDDEWGRNRTNPWEGDVGWLFAPFRLAGIRAATARMIAPWRQRGAGFVQTRCCPFFGGSRGDGMACLTGTAFRLVKAQWAGIPG